MRYLKSKFQFLKDADYIDTAKHNKINEATNDVTWGGSLIGRLINSAIRKRNISKAGSKIEPLVQEFKDYLDRLLPELSGEEDKNAMLRMLIYYLLLQIYRVVMSGQSVQVRLYILLTPAQYANSGTGPVNTSFNNRFSKYLKLNEAENKSDENDLVGTLGLIERTITELKSSQLKTKDELISKLEGFRDEIMKIPFEKEGEVSDEVIDDILGTSDSGDSNAKGSDKEDDNKEDEESEDTTAETDSEFYVGAKKLITDYLRLISDIKNINVKKQKSVKVGDIVVWKEDGKSEFGKVAEVQAGKIKAYKLDAGKQTTESSTLDSKDIRVLTDFDDDKYAKMRQKLKSPLDQTPADFLRQAIFQARVAYYTYLHKNDKAKQDKYYKDIQEFSQALNSQQKKNEGHIFEDLVSIKGKDATESWEMIMSAYNSKKEANSADFSSHLEFLSDLLNKKVNGESNPKKAIDAILLLGARYLKSLKSKDAKILESSQESLEQLLSSARKSAREVEKLEDNINKAADIMAAISLPVLRLKDRKDFSEFKDSNGKGVGNTLESFIKSFNALLSPVKKRRESLAESFITSYERFRMINEAEEESQDEDDSSQETSNQPTDQTNTDKDPIVVAWFKFFKKGDEKQWEIESDKAKEFKAKIEKEKMDFTVGGSKTEEESEPSNEALKIINESSTLPDDVEDPIMKIIDIFGKAYNLYASEYIPSGRPGGRVSQKTLREYVFIGKGERSADASRDGDYYTPGRGPWAVKKIHDKWVAGIKSVINDSTYRAILANVNFVSKAESKRVKPTGDDTRQEQGKIAGDKGYSKGSGISLMEFITKMLYLTETFSEAANTLTRKYFNIEYIDEKNKPPGKPPRRTNQPATAEDKKPFFTPTQVPNNSGRSLRSDAFFLFEIEYTFNSRKYTKYWIAWIVKKHVGNSKLIFRMQETQTNPAETMIEKWHQAPNEMDRVRTGGGATPGVRLGAPTKEVFLCIAEKNIIQNSSAGGDNIYVLQLGTRSAGPGGNVDTTNATVLESAVSNLANFFEYKIDRIVNLNILCKNEDGGFYARDTVITHQWNRANKVTPDVEINGTAVTRINALTIP